MNLSFLVLSLGASALLMLSGYLLGARRSSLARDALRAELEAVRRASGAGPQAFQSILEQVGATLRSSGDSIQAQLQKSLQALQPQEQALRQEIHQAVKTLQSSDLALQEELRKALQVSQSSDLALQEELQNIAVAVQSREQDFKSLHQTLQASQSQGHDFQQEFHQAVQALQLQEQDLKELIQQDVQLIIGSLLERPSERTEVLAAVREVLDPLLHRERLLHDLSFLDSDVQTRGQLPALLDSLAEKGGFTTVLLTDEVGLPLATNQGAKNAETLAAVSALLLTLVDRIRDSGNPAPLSAVFRDEENQLSIYRVFRPGNERYVLTAVTSGTSLTPDILDPALPRIEHLLSSESW